MPKNRNIFSDECEVNLEEVSLPPLPEALPLKVMGHSGKINSFEKRAKHKNRYNVSMLTSEE